MKNIFNIGVLTLTLGLTGLSQAGTAPVVTHVWAVSDAISAHGLFTGDQFYNGDDTFHFSNNARLTQYSDGTATLLGNAADSGVTWNLNVRFSGFNTVSDGAVKIGGGPKLSSWVYYYNTIGDISNNLGDTVHVERFGPALQIGLGANDKTLTFGGSAWLENYGPGHTNLPGRWDLNFNLTPVPEPGTWAMMAAGLGMLGFLARRKNGAKLG